MKFLWRSQLKKERGKFLPHNTPIRKQNRKERLTVSLKQSPGGYKGALVLWLLFFGTVGYVVLFSSYLALQTPQVNGLVRIDRADFEDLIRQELSQKYFGYISRQRYFLLQSKRLEATLLSKYPLLQQVSVRRVFPNTIRIQAEEREWLLVWCSATVCSQILEDGSVVPLTDAFQAPENVSRTLTLRDTSGQPLSFGTHVFDPDMVRFPLAVKQALEERFSLTIENEMSLTSRFANELRVKTNEGWEIYFGTRIPLDASLMTLELVLQKEIPASRRHDIRYVDLRTENRVFYRYQDGKDDPSSNIITHVVENVAPTKDTQSATKKK